MPTSVLHHVQNAHAVLAADGVELLDQRGAVQPFAVHRHRNTLFKVNGHVLGLVGCFFRGNAHLHVARVLGLVGGVLQLQPSWDRCHRFLSLE
jgi:hypothetical protein